SGPSAPARTGGARPVRQPRRDLARVRGDRARGRGLMQINRLRLVNFRQHADTTLEFETGLTGVVGPNGAGKTTLLEAIAWAMYGTAAARGNRDSIRRRSAPPRSRVEVELDFGLGPHRYRVSRSLQGAALYQDGEASPIANSSAAVTDKVTRLLG